jgi:K+-sensing histidine kinase KdpD
VRLAATLMAVNAGIFLVVGGASLLAFLRFGGGETSTLIFIGLLAIGFQLSAVVATIAVDRAMKQVGHLARTVDEQISAGTFTLEFDDLGDGEISQLGHALSSLGQGYRRSVAELGRRAEELAALNLLAETINRTFDLQEVLNVSLREVLRTTSFRKGAIYMGDEHSSTLTMVSYMGLGEDALRRFITRKPGEGLVGMVAQSREMIFAAGETPYPEADVGLHIAIPLETTSGELLGVLTVGGEPAQLDDDRRKLLVTSAYQIALAIDKAHLYEQVRKHAEELERKVEERTQQLNRAVEELSMALERAREADRIKSMLLSTVSHELRTPLATIKGNTSLLRRAHDRIDAETLVEHLVDIDEETDKLTDLISNLLDMSRIEAGILTITPTAFEMEGVIEGSVSSARMRRQHHSFSVKLPEGETAFGYGDPRRIEQVLSNLLDNAAKYSPEGSHIEVGMRDRDSKLEVWVRDEGQGIHPDKLPHIFDRFFQVDGSGDSMRNGVGLGLAICRGLIESHNGEIWVESELGEGSTFAFSIPTADISVLNTDG